MPAIKDNTIKEAKKNNQNSTRIIQKNIIQASSAASVACFNACELNVSFLPCLLSIRV
jgi:hypothetical protein